jgi:hypothetical protein
MVSVSPFLLKSANLQNQFNVQALLNSAQPVRFGVVAIEDTPASRINLPDTFERIRRENEAAMSQISGIYSKADALRKTPASVKRG